jgi:hypothetical protein
VFNAGRRRYQKNKESPRSMERSVFEPAPKTRFDLRSIEASLRALQNEFPRINGALNFSRERMDDELVENLLSGYALVGQLLDAKVELFALGRSACLLELNTRVLCGTDEAKRREYKKHIAANHRHFYERTGAGIQDLAEWHALHAHEPVWQRAAGVYIRILSEPQAFIEGNDRTGSLVMSYILAQQGLPPFVLAPSNARAYFGFSTMIKKTPRNSLAGLLFLPRLKSRMAGFLKSQAAAAYRP